MRSKVSVDLPNDESVLEDKQDMADFKRVYPSYDNEDSDIAFTSPPMQNLWVDEKDASGAVNEGPILPTAPADKETTPTTTKAMSTAATVRSDIRTDKPTPMQGAIALQTQQLEAQIAQVAQQTQEGSTPESDESAQPVNTTLQALSDQIAAIRQYASSQQDRVEKLQSGYDWNIIRTFCVRVIRCIDNLETRMGQCDDEAMIQELGDVHDELIFSLESSGVEQFAPEINSAFCGQERLAEAVKEKVPCTQPALKGCIAEVIKPGYQYVIDDDNVKIVRTARVKLYGDVETISKENERV